MAARNLPGGRRRRARAIPSRAAALGVDDEEIAALARRGRPRWSCPTTSELGVHQQSRGLHPPRALGLRGDAPDEYPLLLHYPYFDLYRKQVVKQADLVLAMLPARRRLHAPRRRRATSPTTSR